MFMDQWKILFPIAIFIALILTSFYQEFFSFAKLFFDFFFLDFE